MSGKTFAAQQGTARRGDRRRHRAGVPARGDGRGLLEGCGTGTGIWGSTSRAVTSPEHPLRGADQRSAPRVHRHLVPGVGCRHALTGAPLELGQRPTGHHVGAPRLDVRSRRRPSRGGQDPLQHLPRNGPVAEPAHSPPARDRLIDIQDCLPPASAPPVQSVTIRDRWAHRKLAHPAPGRRATVSTSTCPSHPESRGSAGPNGCMRFPLRLTWDRGTAAGSPSGSSRGTRRAQREDRRAGTGHAGGGDVTRASRCSGWGRGARSCR